MQSYISHSRGKVFYHLINYLSSKHCPIGLLRKISEIIENIFSLFYKKITKLGDIETGKKKSPTEKPYFQKQ